MHNSLLPPTPRFVKVASHVLTSPSQKVNTIISHEPETGILGQSGHPNTTPPSTTIRKPLVRRRVLVQRRSKPLPQQPTPLPHLLRHPHPPTITRHILPPPPPLQHQHPPPTPRPPQRGRFQPTIFRLPGLVPPRACPKRPETPARSPTTARRPPSVPGRRQSSFSRSAQRAAGASGGSKPSCASSTRSAWGRMTTPLLWPASRRARTRTRRTRRGGADPWISGVRLWDSEGPALSSGDF